jgi:diphosphomevalonate decarboxylase
VNKVSVVSPANIAFIKYWGMVDSELYLPASSSISMTLDACNTRVTVEFSQEDEVWVRFFQSHWRKLQPESIKAKALFSQIERLKKKCGITQGVRILSQNSFPNDAGIASSASSFSGITAALLLLFKRGDLVEDKVELSRQVRLAGSGSAVRSVYGGYVEFMAGHDHESSCARQLSDENHWQLADLVAVVDAGKKKASTSQGHALTQSSPLFQARIKGAEERLGRCRRAIEVRDFQLLGEVVEEDCVSMFAVMMTSKPPLYYWQAGSMAIIQQVIRWREEEGLPVYFTFDAGANAHVLVEVERAELIRLKLEAMPEVKWVIEDKTGKGLGQIEEHLVME